MTGATASFDAQAGEGHDHGDAAPAATGGNSPKRQADGSVFLPKPAQRQIGVRTLLVEPGELPRTHELAGKVVMDPNAGGKVQAIVAGIAEGCVQAGCALLGGETAEHPGLMEDGHYDISATGVGVVEADAVLSADRVRPGDVVIAMGCGDTCPIFPGKRYEDWDVADPADQPIEVVRDIRDDIQARVTTLLREILN